MTILAVDTALSACSVAILSDDRQVTRSQPMQRGHAEALMPMLADALTDAGIEYGDVDRFAVTVGPGTFTGVRVGVSAVRGLALVTGRPAVGVTTLEALAGTARALPGARPDRLLVAMDARRDEIYAQLFGPGDENGEPAVIAVDDLLRDLPVDVDAVFGSAAGMVAEAAAETGHDLTVLGTEAAPDPLVVARIGGQRTPGDAPRPFYLRPPDAKPQHKAVLARK